MPAIRIIVPDAKPPRETRHRCPVSICTWTIPAFKLLCRTHFAMVGAGTRRAWQHARETGNEADMERLAAEAVAAVERKIAGRS